MPYTQDMLKDINNNAAKLGVSLKPSTNKAKKFDVYKDGKKVASIGSSSNLDYIYYKGQDMQLAHKRRQAYIARHQKNLEVKDSNGYYAFHILWS